MNQESAQMVQQQHSQTTSELTSLDDWQILVEGSSQTKEGEENPYGFRSEGKWSFEIKRRELNEVSTHVMDLIKNQFGLQDDDLQIEFHGDIKTIQSIFDFVGIQTQLKSQNQWRDNFALWDITDVRVSVNDGNTTIVDFKNGQYHFVLFYQTVLKDVAFTVV